jgi:segregation and condensation protein A
VGFRGRAGAVAEQAVAVRAVAVTGRDGRLAYQLRLPQFEGPLDLLLNLIERRELEVTAISLAAVADQFLAHVADLAADDAGVLAEFVAVAARLVLIKSRALLPRPPQPAEDEAESDDAEALAQQLVAYRAARATALALAERQLAGVRAYSRPPAPLPARAAPPPLAPVSLADLVRAVRRRLLALPAEPAPAALAPVVSLADTIAAIEAILARDGQTCLTALLERARSRAEAIVTFIGLLELIRRRRIVAAQAVLFGEILIVAADGAA